MNSFMKISIGFIFGVVCTISVLYFISESRNTEENRLRDEIQMKMLKDLNESFDKIDKQENQQINVQSFELTTNKGIVKLHTNMTKDSVMILMGRPRSTNINENEFNDNVNETWKFKGSNKYIDEFTIEFTNGKLKSVSQFKE
jgi:hypothetical protein